MAKTKEAYLLWHGYHATLPKTQRYSLGIRIDSLFIDVMESIAAATFLSKEEKHPYIRLAIKKLDTLKVLLDLIWETGTFGDKKYIAVSAILDEVGKMLGGWSGQFAKQNSPIKAGEK